MNFDKFTSGMINIKYIAKIFTSCVKTSNCLSIRVYPAIKRKAVHDLQQNHSLELFSNDQDLIDMPFIPMKGLIYLYILSLSSLSIVKAVSNINNSKAPFKWDLNKLPIDEEEQNESIISKGESNEHDHRSNLENVQFAVDWVGKRKRTGRGNHKAVILDKKITKSTKAKREKIKSRRQQTWYQNLTPKERKELIRKNTEQGRERIMKMNVKEWKAYRAKRNAEARQTIRNLYQTGTEEEKQNYKFRRSQANRKYYLAHKAKQKERQDS